MSFRSIRSIRSFRGLLIRLIGVGCISFGLVAQAQESVDRIVAAVDEDIIMSSELDTAIRGITDRIRAQGGSLPPQDLMEKQVLERLVVRKLQVQRALKTGIRVSDSDIDNAMTTLSQQNNMTLEQLRRAIEADGENYAEFRTSIGEEILTERLRQRVVNSMDPVSETEIDILMASEDFAGGEYNISHIMIGLPDGATPAQITEAQKRIDEIHTQLDGGLDFASAAISFSESQEALEGGLVGWRDLNSIPREFADGLRDMRVGQYSQPLRSPAGFHIVRVNDYRDKRQIMSEEFRASHILIVANELVSAREAMDLARDLHSRIIGGEDFAELAREHSDDTTTANIGGDMGWFPSNQFGDRMKVTLETLADGEISEPFQTEEGWHIMQRTGFRETDVTVEAMRNQARQTIMQRRADSEVESYLRQMREEAYVDIRLPS